MHNPPQMAESTFDGKIFRGTKPVRDIEVLLYTGIEVKTIEPQHETSNNAVCATSKGSDQPANLRRLIRVIACRLSIF